MIRFYFKSRIQGLTDKGLTKGRDGPAFEVLGERVTDVIGPLLDLAVKDLLGRGRVSYSISAKDIYGKQHIITYGRVDIEVNKQDEINWLLQEKREELL